MKQVQQNIYAGLHTQRTILMMGVLFQNHVKRTETTKEEILQAVYGDKTPRHSARVPAELMNKINKRKLHLADCEGDTVETDESFYIVYSEQTLTFKLVSRKEYEVRKLQPKFKRPITDEGVRLAFGRLERRIIALEQKLDSLNSLVTQE